MDSRKIQAKKRRHEHKLTGSCHALDLMVLKVFLQGKSCSGSITPYDSNCARRSARASGSTKGQCSTKHSSVSRKCYAR